jgi:hypothetical protein
MAKMTQDPFIKVEDYTIKAPTEGIQEYDLYDLRLETWTWRK